jgi:1-acyl-sn-glycerol-3-phosphate acyltransferase
MAHDLNQPAGSAPLVFDMTSAGPPAIRDAIVSAVMAFLAAEDARTLEDVRACLDRELDDAGTDALVALSGRLGSIVGDWTYYPAEPLARRIHRAVADRILLPGSGLFGVAHLEVVAGEAVVIFCNHLSYSDANLLQVLLQRAGASELADRLTAVAGPKVYSSLRRRFSSLCFGTIRVPQSSTLSSDDAVMGVRDVAAAARRSIESAHARLGMGDALVLFAEGTRSRTSELHALLPGVARYLAHDDLWVLPIGMTGSETLFPVGQERLHPVKVIARVGRPARAGALRERAGRDRRVMMDAVGMAIADLLPENYRGFYGEGHHELDAARGVARGVFGVPS